MGEVNESKTYLKIGTQSERNKTRRARLSHTKSTSLI